MKKFLLLLAAVATCASAYAVDAELEYMNQAWKVNSGLPGANDSRQGFGMNGKFYVLDKASHVILVYGQNGKEDELELPETSSWPAITHDEAGNIIARIDGTWPNAWDLENDAIRIFPAGGGDPLDQPLPAEAITDWGQNARQDFFSFAEGNVMEEGALYIVCNNSTSIFKLAFVEGFIDGDNSRAFEVSGAAIAADNTTVVNPYTAADGTKHYLYVKRNAVPVDMTFDEDNNQFVGTTVSLPNKGACNGAFPFSLGGYNLVLYPTLPNYLDGFAVAEAGAEEAIATQDPSYGSNPNGIQINWLNAEPVEGSQTKATIYQYVAGGYVAAYDFKLKTTVTAVKDVNAARQLTGVKYYNVAGVESATPFDGVNIMVNVYDDGSREATKVLR
ncbi:MAG: hypothetical protein J6X70_01880 [Muribaculaceae bacterium]|nr:hypothetical protein [Muribaculaceae bacterium]